MRPGPTCNWPVIKISGPGGGQSPVRAFSIALRLTLLLFVAPLSNIHPGSGWREVSSSNPNTVPFSTTTPDARAYYAVFEGPRAVAFCGGPAMLCQQVLYLWSSQLGTLDENHAHHTVAPPAWGVRRVLWCSAYVSPQFHTPFSAGGLRFSPGGICVASGRGRLPAQAGGFSL